MVIVDFAIVLLGIDNIPHACVARTLLKLRIY